MSKKFLTAIRLVNLPNSPSTGHSGELYYDSTNNVIKYYNGSSWISPGSALTVQQTDSNGNATVSYSNISTLQFDGGSGFVVTDPATGVVKISLNSTFKYWKINGQPALTAEGEDTINLIAGNGISLSSSVTNGNKSLTIASTPSPNGFLPVYYGEPRNPVIGQMYFDASLKTVKAYDGFSWYHVGGPHVVTDHIHSYDGNVSRVIDGQYVYSILNLDGGYASTISYAGQSYDGGNSATVSFFDIINSGGAII